MRPVEETTLFGSGLVYTRLRPDRPMNNAIEVTDAEEFVKGESSRDLQVSLDARDLAIQFIETVDTLNDFLSLYRGLDASDSKESTEPI